MSRKVIDLSSHNTNPKDWSALANDVDGVIIRCGYRGYGKKGTLVEDKKFKYFRNMCKANGIPWGVYFFPTSITEAEAIEEADFVNTLLEGDRPDFPIFADSETAEVLLRSGRSDNLSATDRTKYLLAFLGRLQEHGYPCGVYASTSWFYNRLIDGQLINYPHWVAQYASKCTYPGDMIAWQFTSNGTVAGMTKRVDISEWYEDANNIRVAKPVLRRGSKGSEVAYLQDNLCRFGFVIDVDGRFGPATEAAVIGWQIANDLVGDGIYGPKSYAKMKELLN